MFLRVFSRKWWLATILVLLGMGALVRLGIWQLDRLATRRAFNARVMAASAMPALTLDGGSANQDLASMEYRAVVVQGEYDFSQEVALKNQAWNDQYGVHLFTPLHMAGSDQTVMVDRGWIPAADYEAGNWNKYQEPGVVTVHGIIRRSQAKADFGKMSDPAPAAGERIKAWNLANIEAMSKQMPYPILPVYIHQSPEAGWTGMPYRSNVEMDLTEGPHMGYAIQWFTFATILGVGYPFYVQKMDSRRKEER